MCFRVIADKIKLLSVCRGLTAQNVADLRAMRHDLCNHLCAISGLAQLGDTARITGYVSDMLGLLAMNALLAGTGCAPVDAILADKLNRAREMDLILSLDTAPLPALGLRDCDLALIVASLLDHGLAQARRVTDRPRQIHFTLKMENGFLLVRCAHPVKGARPNKALAAKVRKCAAKYGGVCRFQLKGGTLLTEIYLPAQAAQAGAAL